MKYQLTIGSMIRENGAFVTNDMVAKDVTTFDSAEESMEAFNDINVRDIFATEWDCATVKPKDGGIYCEIMAVEVDEDGYEEDIEELASKQFTADDLMKERY